MFQRVIPLVGEGPVAEAIAGSLRACGVRPRLIGPRGLESSGLHRATELILMAQPGSEWQELLERVDRLCVRSRSGRAAPLQVAAVAVGGDSAQPLHLPRLLPHTRLRLRPFSLARQAARALLTRFPPHMAGDVAAGQTVHLLIVGFDWLGQALALQTMRLAHYGAETPRVTVVVREAAARADRFKRAYPQAERACRLQFLELDAPEPDPASPVTSVFICLEDEAAALGYRERVRTWGRRHHCAAPPVFLRAGAERTGGELADWDGQTYPFCPYREACRPELLFGDRGDALARIIHAYYRDTIAAQGRDLASTPADQAWETLDESYRQASRHQADHLPAKLAAIDCRAVTDTAAELFLFSPLEVERLAGIEHVRWCADRYLDGWRFGPRRDNRRKLHPDLIPYRELSEDLKDLDRFAVRLLPALLARLARGLERDLLVGVAVAGEGARPDRRMRRSLKGVLQRLRERFPDRTLVLASALRHPLERLLVRQAIHGFQAPLYFLSTGCALLPDDGPGSVAARKEFLALLARAERRFAFADPEALRQWLEQRSDVLIRIASDSSAEAPMGAPRPRQVSVNGETGVARYSFEY